MRINDVYKIDFEVKGNSYSLVDVEFFTKGDLKGYINCMLQDNQTNKQYETLYRVSDIENGNDFTLVSVDYGWKLNDNTIIHNAEMELTVFASKNKLIDMLEV
ncbi:MAG: hypothetical protein ACRDD7_08490 [Peptostreptococcaceae bacterium]